MTRKLAVSRAALTAPAAHLVQLSPLKILDRGYAIVSTVDGTIVKSTDQAPGGTQLNLRVAAGTIRAKV